MIHLGLAGVLFWLAMDRPPVLQIGSVGAVTIVLVDGSAEPPAAAGASGSPAPSHTPPRIEPKLVGATQDNASPIQPAGTDVSVEPAFPQPVQAPPDSSSQILTASLPDSAASSTPVIAVARDAGGADAAQTGEADDVGPTEAAPSGGAVIDETDPWPAYYAAVRAAVQRVQQYPFSARLAGLEDRVKVGFRITADGSAEQIHLTESSRFPVLNEAAVDTVRRAARFPAPPLHDGQSGVRVTVPLEFTLHHQEEVSPH